MRKNNFSFKIMSLVALVFAVFGTTLAACSTSNGPAPSVQATTLPPTLEPVGTSVPSPVAFSEDELKNASYTLPDIGEVQLKDGHFEQKYGQGATQVNQVDFQQMAIGDLNKDGAPDVAVILAVNTGGSGVFIYMAVLLNQGGNPVQAAIEQLGDRVQVNALGISQGQIELNFLGFGPNDPMCCPSQITNRVYVLQNGGLKMVSESNATATP